MAWMDIVFKLLFKLEELRLFSENLPRKFYVIGNLLGEMDGKSCLIFMFSSG